MSSLCRWLLLQAFVSSAATAHALPVIATPVVDEAAVLGPADEETIAAALLAMRAKTGVQMAVLTVTTLGGEPIEDYAQAVFDAWGGGSKTRNDGVLFVLAINDRQSRLELGYGIEPLITDARAVEMLDRLRPALRAGAYGEAGLEIVTAVAEATDHLTPESTIDAPSRPLGERGATFVVVGLIAWLCGIVFGWHRDRQTKTRKVLRAGAPLRHRVRAGFLAWPTSLVALLVWAIAPSLVLSIITGDSGFAFGAGYAVAWYIYAALGVVASQVVGTSRTNRIVFLVLMAALVGVTAALLPLDLSEMPGVGVGLLAVMTAMVLVIVTAFFVPGGSGSGSSGFWTSSATGSSGASSASYTSSASYSSSSSSSSSSSWSGGGGSSGGGGASSSW